MLNINTNFLWSVGWSPVVDEGPPFELVPQERVILNPAGSEGDRSPLRFLIFRKEYNCLSLNISRAPALGMWLGEGVSENTHRWD